MNNFEKGPFDGDAANTDLPPQLDAMGPESIEGVELSPEEAAQVATWLEVLRDPAVLDGVAAVTRTLLNLGLTLADFLPGGLGDAISDIPAGVLKVTGPVIKALTGLNPDLTPAISKKLAVTAEGGLAPLEAATGGTLPTYGFLAFTQFKRQDLGLIKGAFRKIKALRSGDSSDAAIHDAARVFTSK